MKLPHCTQFLLDYVSTQKENTLQDYNKREADYDLNFIKTWENFIYTKALDCPEKMLELFLKIQETAMNHIKSMGITEQGEKYQSGIVTKNLFGVSNGPNSNWKGIQELAEKIWFDKKPLQITAHTENDKCYVLYKDGFALYDSKKAELIKNLYKNDSSEKTLKNILITIKKCYDQGVSKEGDDPITINCILQEVHDKKYLAIEIFSNYLEAIQKAESAKAKIEIILRLATELEQIHLFHDGNGRSVFILVNILLLQNGLDPTYPKNMCMFDANSLKTMVNEVVEGQKRFKTMFGDVEKLTKNLKDYRITVEKLLDKYSTYKDLMNSIKERNFNLLLRQVAALKDSTELLKFLLENLEILNIDINSKSKKSGTAMKIAIKNKNKEAIELLKKYQKEESSN